jgi:hypothetical protein
MEEKLYEVVKLKPNADNPPDYLQEVTMKELCAFYFNWHTGQTHATEAEVREWFKKKGWEWREYKA